MADFKKIKKGFDNAEAYAKDKAAGDDFKPLSQSFFDKTPTPTPTPPSPAQYQPQTNVKPDVQVPYDYRKVPQPDNSGILPGDEIEDRPSPMQKQAQIDAINKIRQNTIDQSAQLQQKPQQVSITPVDDGPIVQPKQSPVQTIDNQQDDQQDDQTKMSPEEIQNLIKQYSK